MVLRLEVYEWGFAGRRGVLLQLPFEKKKNAPRSSPDAKNTIVFTGLRPLGGVREAAVDFF